MTTKQDFLNRIRENVEFVIGVSHKAEYVSEDGTRTADWYIVSAFSAEDTNVVNRSFYVLDEGTESEAAYWFNGQDPWPAPTGPTFQQELTAWLQTKVADGTIMHFSDMTANNSTERATCTIVLDQSSNFVEKRVALWKDAQGSFRFRVLS